MLYIPPCRMMPKSCAPSANISFSPCFVDEFLRGGPALVDFLLLVQEARRRQDDAADVANGILHGIFQGEFRADVVLGDEAAVDVAGADAQLEHDGSVRCFG